MASASAIRLQRADGKRALAFRAPLVPFVPIGGVLASSRSIRSRIPWWAARDSNPELKHMSR